MPPHDCYGTAAAPGAEPISGSRAGDGRSTAQELFDLACDLLDLQAAVDRQPRVSISTVVGTVANICAALDRLAHGLATDPVEASRWRPGTHARDAAAEPVGAALLDLAGTFREAQHQSQDIRVLSDERVPSAPSGDHVPLPAAEHAERRAESASVVDRAPHIVTAGSVVDVDYVRTGRRATYRVTSEGTASSPGCVSAGSPLGRALMGRRLGETVSARLSRGRIARLRIVGLRPGELRAAGPG